MDIRLSSAVALLALTGCASTANSDRWSEYVVAGVRVNSSQDAENTHRGQVNAASLGATSGFDKPLRLLRAPQPAMPREDTDNRVTGEVVVQLHFNTTGTVDRVLVVRSTKESLSAAVIDAVSKWQIEPATKRGDPSRVVVQQSFAFRAEW